MRILLDECVPRGLRRELGGHDIRTVTDLGWSGKKNGDLLRSMSDRGFEVLVTVDQNLSRQQNLRARGISLIVLTAARGRLIDLLPLMPAVRVALESIRPGDVIVISG